MGLPGPSWLKTARNIAIAGLIAFAVHAQFPFGGPAVSDFFNHWVYLGLLVLGSLICLARVVTVPKHRTAWGFLTFGVAAWLRTQGERAAASGRLPRLERHPATS